MAKAKKVVEPTPEEVLDKKIKQAVSEKDFREVEAAFLRYGGYLELMNND